MKRNQTCTTTSFKLVKAPRDYIVFKTAPHTASCHLQWRYRPCFVVELCWKIFSFHNRKVLLHCNVEEKIFGKDFFFQMKLQNYCKHGISFAVSRIHVKNVPIFFSDSYYLPHKTTLIIDLTSYHVNRLQKESCASSFAIQWQNPIKHFQLQL